MRHFYIKFKRSVRSLIVRGCGDFDGNIEVFFKIMDDDTALYAFVTVYDDGTEETHYYEFNGLEWVEIDYNIL